MSRKLQLILAILSPGITAFAQSDTSSKNLDPVIVTANKLPQKQSSTGKIVTVISREEIQKSGAETLSQLLNKQTGITINGALNNPGTNQTFFLRGASGGRTLILIDGIPVSDPSVISNEFDLNLVSIQNVECIEVCRGSQSTTYGSDAEAGVVNIITTSSKKLKPFELKLSGSSGNYAIYRGNMDLAGNYRKLTYSVRYSYLSSKGFSAAHDSTNSKNFDHDGFKGTVLNSSVKWQCTEFLSVRGFLQYSTNKTGLDAAAFTDEKDYVLINKALITGSTFQYNRNKVSLTASYQFSTNGRTYLNDSLDTPGFTKFSKDRYHGQVQFLDIYSKVDLEGGFSLLQGADYRQSRMNSENFSISSFGPFKSAFKDTSQSQASLYASLFFNSRNHRLSTDIGGRINLHSQYGTNSTFTFNPSFFLANHYRLTASVSSGFKAPTLYQLYSAYGNRSLQPEKSLTYEFGIEQHRQNFTGRITCFHRTIEQGIDFNYVTFKYFNITEQVVNGVELEATVQPVKNFRIALNYAYLDPKEKSQSRISFIDTTYKYLLRRPRHNLNFSAGYSFKNGLYLSTGAKYLSARHDIGAYKEADVTLDSYFLLNVYSEYQFTQKLKLFLNLQNVTNQKFFDILGYNSIPLLFNTGFTLSL